VDDAGFLQWTKVLATAPAVAKRGRPVDGDDEDEGGGGEGAQGGVGSLTCRLGASAIFNTAHEKRGHLAAFHSDVRDVKGMDKENLAKFIKAIAEKDSTFNESYPGTKDLAKLKVIDWLGAQYGFADEKTGEVANSILGSKDLKAAREATKKMNAAPSPPKAPAPPPAPRDYLWRLTEADRVHGAENRPAGCATAPPARAPPARAAVAAAAAAPAAARRSARKPA